MLRPRRTLAIGAIADIVGDPVIDGGRVIVAGASGEMAAFDLARGDARMDRRGHLDPDALGRRQFHLRR